MNNDSISNPSLVITNGSFRWQNGEILFQDINAEFTQGKTGLIGDNGEGKTTLLRLLSGELKLDSGSISRRGTVGYLPQNLITRSDITIAKLFSVQEKMDAIRAIENGATDQALFDIVGDDWDCEERVKRMLAKMNVAELSLDRTMASLSGGEATLVAILALETSPYDILLLDEPTNNLDLKSRNRLYELIHLWTKPVIIASHDRALLDLMDSIVELYEGSLYSYGGNYSFYERAVEESQQSARKAFLNAKATYEKERKNAISIEEHLAKRKKAGKRAFEQKRDSKKAMNAKKRKAQVSASKAKAVKQDRLGEKFAEMKNAAKLVREDDQIQVDYLNERDFKSGIVAKIYDDAGHSVLIGGRDRVVLQGENGVGKTSLIEAMLGLKEDSDFGVHGQLYIKNVGYIPQRIDYLMQFDNAFDAVKDAAPQMTTSDLRTHLSHFLLKGDAVFRPMPSLSGGETLRVALARILLADPPNDMLILDEPTNNLDLKSTRVLTRMLNQYAGALLIVSHDQHFISSLSVMTTIAIARSQVVLL